MNISKIIFLSLLVTVSSSVIGMEPDPEGNKQIVKNAQSLKFIILNRLAKKQIKYDPSLLPVELHEYLAQLDSLIKKHKKSHPNENLEDNPTQALFTATEDIIPEIVRDLVSMGANINAYNNSLGFINGTPLHFAVWRANVPLIRALVENGALVNSRTSDSRKLTPLHLLVTITPYEYVFCEKVIRFLLENNADINAVADTVQNTPLNDAVRYKNIYAVRLLLQKNADHTIANTFGETPLQQAEALGFEPIVELLKEHQAKQQSSK